MSRDDDLNPDTWQQEGERRGGRAEMPVIGAGAPAETDSPTPRSTPPSPTQPTSSSPQTPQGPASASPQPTRLETYQAPIPPLQDTPRSFTPPPAPEPPTPARPPAPPPTRIGAVKVVLGLAVGLLVIAGLFSGPPESPPETWPAGVVYSDSIMSRHVQVVGASADLEIDAVPEQKGVAIHTRGGGTCTPTVTPVDRSVRIDATCKSAGFKIVLPTGKNLSVTTDSGDVTIDGNFGEVEGTSKSGAVALRARPVAASDFSSVVLTSESGKVTYQSRPGWSGRIRQLTLTTQSGDVDVSAESADTLSVRSTSGDVGARITPTVGRVLIDTTSGDVSVRGVTRDRTLMLSSTWGRINNKVTDARDGADGQVSVTTKSGDIDILGGAK